MKNLIVRQVLKHLTHGDTGSTLLGLVSFCLLSTNINFDDLYSKDTGKQAVAWGTLISTLIIVLWGFYIGKEPISQIKSTIEKGMEIKGDDSISSR